MSAWAVLICGYVQRSKKYKIQKKKVKSNKNKKTQCATAAWHLSPSACMSGAVLICGYAQTQQKNTKLKIKIQKNTHRASAAWHIACTSAGANMFKCTELILGYMGPVWIKVLQCHIIFLKFYDNASICCCRSSPFLFSHFLLLFSSSLFLLSLPSRHQFSIPRFSSPTSRNHDCLCSHQSNPLCNTLQCISLCK